MLDVPAALMAGAAVITKPSEATPLTWSEMVRGFREEIDAPAVLGAVVEEVDTIMFTGSTRTGRAVAVQAAQRLIPSSLELGRKDPMIFLGDILFSGWLRLGLHRLEFGKGKCAHTSAGTHSAA